MDAKHEYSLTYICLIVHSEFAKLNSVQLRDPSTFEVLQVFRFGEKGLPLSSLRKKYAQVGDLQKVSSTPRICQMYSQVEPHASLQAQYLSKCVMVSNLRGNAQISRQLMIAHVTSAALDRSCWRRQIQTSFEVIRIVINSIRLDFSELI